jgi:hypothetical protein
MREKMPKPVFELESGRTDIEKEEKTYTSRLFL